MTGWTGWRDAVVATLAECKADGMLFSDAWEVAMRRHPPRAMELGPERATLFDLDEPSVVDFMHQACSDAWHGRKPWLSGVREGLEAIATERPAAGALDTRVGRQVSRA